MRNEGSSVDGQRGFSVLTKSHKNRILLIQDNLSYEKYETLRLDSMYEELKNKWIIIPLQLRIESTAFFVNLYMQPPSR
jgi:hypothetical protein